MFFCCLHVLAPNRYIGVISYLLIVIKGNPSAKYACADRKSNPEGVECE